MRLVLFGKISLVFCLCLLFFFVSFGQCNNSYQKLWGLSNGGSINVSSATLTVNNDLPVCGSIFPFGFIVKYNQAQSVIWAKTYGIGSSSSFSKIISLQNGGIAAAGYTSEGSKSSFCVLKFDAAGNVIWTKRFLDISSVPGLTFQYPIMQGFVETPDGGLVLCGRKIYLRPDNGFNNRNFVFKIGASGNVEWTREDTFGNEDESLGMVVDQGSIFIVGTTNVTTIGARCGFLEKLDPANGVIQFLKFYQFPGVTSNWFRSIEKTSNGLEIGTQSFPFAGVKWFHDFKVDYLGNQTELKNIPDPVPALNLLDQYYHPVPMPDGGTLFWKNWYYSSTEASLAKIYSDRSTTWSFEYSLPGKQTLYEVLANPDNTALLVGTSPELGSPSGSNKIFLSRIKLDGTIAGCPAVNEPFPVKDSLTYQVTNGTWQTTQLNFEAPLNATAIEGTFQLVENMLCSEGYCIIDTIKISGETIICGQQATINYKASKVGNCVAKVSWSLIPAIGNITTVNDSTIQIKFTTAGTAVLSANVSTACFNKNTSISLNYMPSSTTLNLGGDTAYCKGDTIHLSVDNSFQYVLWNTNTTVKRIPVFIPGKYYVSATNDSVCFFRDTINIIENTLPVVDLGNYSKLCQSDSLFLNAGNNFKSYLWQDASVLPSYRATTLGMYWVKVTDYNNCSASSDTVNIVSISLKPTHFVQFSDTSICSGKIITLRLLNNYATYSWNNGAAITPTYLAKNAGLYTIKVTNNDGCEGYDSVNVNTKKCLQKIFVPTAFTPNADNLNDFFKPVFFGEIDFFEMNIYNRYGQMVYKTDKAENGWNGTFLGEAQVESNFVWVIRCRFVGAADIEQISGNVILLR